MSVLVVINPQAGHRRAAAFFNEHVAHTLPDHAITTEHNAPQLIARTTKPLTVVLASGDGTLHEIINDLLPATDPVSFVLLPCGTANALYASLFPPTADESPAYKLQSLQAFLDGKHPIHLSLATTTISSPPKVSVASVVVSTALHASILHDSEALREQHPGIERFKIAAQQNSTKWYKSSVKLFPSLSTGNVQIYHRSSKSFIPLDESTVHLDGPFVYFLSTVNVDRLEPAFRIAPLVRAIPPDGPVCDIVILRPLRDPSLSTDTPEAREAFVAKTWKVLTDAYQDGAHVDLAYTDTGEITSDAQGPSVIEYYRCGGWEWAPDPNDPDAHLVCCDGAISTISPQGNANCIVDTFKHNYSVYV